jgi:hypothetical protein
MPAVIIHHWTLQLAYSMDFRDFTAEIRKQMNKRHHTTVAALNGDESGRLRIQTWERCIPNLEKKQ